MKKIILLVIALGVGFPFVPWKHDQLKEKVAFVLPPGKILH